jgi:hypothetical protein
LLNLRRSGVVVRGEKVLVALREVKRLSVSVKRRSTWSLIEMVGVVMVLGPD